MTNVARSLRGLVPVLAALATATVAALPAAAAPGASGPVTRAGEWWLAAVHAPAATGTVPAAGNGATVAVLSTGVDASHPDLAGSVTTGPDFSGTGREQGSPYWGAEGTAVASLIAGHGHGPGGSQGITGIAPGARILSLRVTLEYNDPLASDAAVTRRLPDAIAAGIRWAAGHGATVIALPLDPGTLEQPGPGNPAAGGSSAEKAAVAFALARGILLVAPAGDNGADGNAVNYPAAYPGVIAVGATTRAGQLSPFSDTRSHVALTAPGAGTTPDPPSADGTLADPAAGLMVAAPGGGYQPLASTDMSAALTAGVAALIRSRYPRLTVAEVTQALERSAAAPPGGAHQAAAGQGHGGLDAAAALSAAAALAAAQPASPPASAAARAPASSAGPASPRPASLTAAGNADPARLLRSLVVDLAAAAGVLIVCLAVAIALTGRRRRARAGRAAGRARHAKGQPADPVTAPIPARVVIWPAAEPPPLPGAFAVAAAPQRRPVPTGNPPWQPAAPPRDPADPPAMLPAQTAAEKPGPPLAPWEQSPEDFAVAPAADGAPPWPVANTGPMYVWNPATSTGPMLAINGEIAFPGDGGATQGDEGAGQGEG